MADRPDTLKAFKREAQALKKDNPGMKHTHALEVLARSYGWRTYAAAKVELDG